MVRCLKCGKTSKKANRVCWKQHQLCGACVKIYYPDVYKMGKLMSKLRYKQKIVRAKLIE